MKILITCPLRVLVGGPNDVKPLKTKIILNYISRFSPYRVVNTLLLYFTLLYYVTLRTTRHNIITVLVFKILSHTIHRSLCQC